MIAFSVQPQRRRVLRRSSEPVQQLCNLGNVGVTATLLLHLVRVTMKRVRKQAW